MTLSKPPVVPAKKHWRWVLWGGAMMMLLLPAIAMQFSAEVNWGAEDFLVFGLMLLGVCAAIELAARFSGAASYRNAVALAAIAAFLLTWVNLAVGIIGDEGHPANWIFAGIVLCLVIGALVVRGRAAGMARLLWIIAGLQVAAGVVALVLGDDDLVVVMMTLLLVALWGGSARLFQLLGGEAPTSQ